MHYRKVIILVICFTLTSVLIYWQPSSKAVEKKLSLSQALSDIKGWKSNGSTPLDPRIVKSLKLDDYVNQTYSNGNNTVSLYIGYYLTTKKVGAAHSPLVCFPGQGWVLSDVEEKSLKIGKASIHLLDMLAARGQSKELVLYWFQAYDRTSPGTFLQKIYTLWAKFIHHREDNAFVRVSIPMENQAKSRAFDTGFAFINEFYPQFLKYVRERTV